MPTLKPKEQVEENSMKVGDRVKTIVNPFDTKTLVRHGVIVYVHPKDAIAPYIVDFGETWGGFMPGQLELDK